MKLAIMNTLHELPVYFFIFYVKDSVVLYTYFVFMTYSTSYGHFLLTLDRENVM
jgi:hypothetical protein